MHRLVPQFILDNFQAQKHQGSFQAVCLLVDVSGFSTMTDVLAQHGPHGSEVLANGMRAVFDPMIHNVLEHGGHLVGFAGDAITALFPVETSLDEAYGNAIAAAQGIQTHRKENASFVTPYGQFNISVKIGLGAGKARWRIIVAEGGKRATYYFYGSCIEQAVSSLSLSKSGEIILCPLAGQSLGKFIDGTKRDKHFRLEKSLGDIPAPVPVDIPIPNPEHMRLFCSEDVSEHELTGEFRPAVNLFIGIQLEDNRETQLEAFLQKVFSLQNLYGGLFSRVDVGDKGTNLLMFWGAPSAHENDVERALSFLLDLIRESGVPMKAGITYRLAYAGYMGGSLQEEYTCYGWGVNLSARLMMAAGSSEIWTDEEIARRAGGRFSFQHVGRQKFKGFSQEQNVFKLLKRKEDDRAVFSGEFIGREADLETLGRFIGPIWGGNFAGMLTVTGEPGIGKSRLVDAFQASDMFIEKKTYWAICQADEIVRQSLNPFRYWLKRYFDIKDTMDDAQSKRTFDEKIEEVIASIPYSDLSQTLNRTRSFLGELVNLHWPESDYEKMDAQGRYDNTFIALSTLLRGESLKQPLIILIEDAHLLDNDTRAFLPYLERTLTAEPDKNYPLAIIATARSDWSEITLDHSPNEEITLTNLSYSDLSRLAENILAGTASPALLETLRQRAEGNPFFIEQILRYLQEEGKLELGRSGWQIAGGQALESLPTDISAILVSRLDRLNREVKEVVQTASVLGREFELRLLSQMLHDETALPGKIQLAVKADILLLLTEIRYIFRHALVRDAAYNMQLRARQQELHQIAVEAFETLYQGQLSPHYSEIAYHADRAGLRKKAKKFYILAGEDAAQAYKNSLAIESYTHALALSSIKDIQERIDLLLARVALYRIVADRDGQEQDLATLEILAERQKSKRNRAIVALRQAGFAFDLGDFHEAQQLAESAIKFAESTNARDVLAQAYRTLPPTLARQGQFQQALQVAQIGIELAQQVDDRPGEGQIYNDIGLILIEQKEHGQASDYFEKSLLIAQETGNRRLEAQVLNNMGNISGMLENDYATARTYFENTLKIVREIGHRIGECHALGNLGWVTSMQGAFEPARVFQENSLTIARETGNRYQEAYTLINLSAMMVTLENYPEALEHAKRALRVTHKIGDSSGDAWALTYLGHANLGLGDHQEAITAYRAALKIRRSLKQESLAMEPIAGLAQVEMSRGETGLALAYVENILSHFASGGNLDGTEEPLRVYLTAYKLLAANRDSRANQILDIAHALLQEQVNKIKNRKNKKMYVQKIPWRKEIEELWLQNQKK